MVYLRPFYHLSKIDHFPTLFVLGSGKKKKLNSIKICKSNMKIIILIIVLLKRLFASQIYENIEERSTSSFKCLSYVIVPSCNTKLFFQLN